MKVVALSLVCLLGLSVALELNADGASPSEQLVGEPLISPPVPTLTDVPPGYHKLIGVPQATQIRRVESRGKPSPAVRIVGGLGSYLGEHPYFAGLVITLTTGQTSVCGSALVSSTRLVTAAQCWWDGRSLAYSMEAVLGSVRLFSGGTRVYASIVLAHGSYDPVSLRNDIAVLVIPFVSNTSYISPIALPSSSELSNSFSGLRGTTVGYGRTSDSASITESASLRDVYQTVMTNAECAQVYGTSVTSGIICTNGSGGKGACGGDAGGPLIVYNSGRNILVGVVSFVAAAGCQSGYPTGNTRVTYYQNWILSNL